MANNYLQFSTAINELTDDEMGWWKTKIVEVDNWDCELDNGPLGIQFSLNEQRKEVWFCSEESGNMEFLANVVQEFLEAHRPNYYFTVTWACTCSKPRLDEFSGGGVLVTASDVKWFDPNDMIYAEIQKMEAAKKA